MKFPKRLFSSGLIFLLSVISGNLPCEAQTPAAPKVEFPQSSQSGAKIELELWSWGEEATRAKLMAFKDGDRIPMEKLPEDVQFRFRIPTDHDTITFNVRSADGEHAIAWGPQKIKPTDEPYPTRLYRAQSAGSYPQAGRYCIEIKAEKAGVNVAEICANFEFVKPVRKPIVRAQTYAGSVGMKSSLPKSMHTGEAVQYELWQWGEEKSRKKLVDLKDGAKIGADTLPKDVQFHFRILTDFDSVTWRYRSSEGAPESGWSKKNIPAADGNAQKLFRAGPNGLFPQTGKYCLEIKAEKAGKVMAENITNFEIVNGKPVPVNTKYLVGKKDWAGNVITTSKPVNLGGLNETPVLKDNDYPFEPQRAFHVINWERFPPFQMHPRFPMVWASRRFTDEDKFGGPMNRGFNSMAVIQSEQDNLKISERTWFHTPDQQVHFINELYKKDPVKYKDLKQYADHRSAFVSEENAILLGKLCYEGWGAGGYGPYDAGLYCWDEEQMFPSIATKMMKEHPELLPERLMVYKEKVLAGDQGAIAQLEKEYTKAWGDFVANTYKGARESAASRGRTFKVWHYGSKAPGEELFLGKENGIVNPKTGKYRYEELDQLHEWFKKGRTIDFNATAYSREIDIFHKDFYYHITSCGDQTSLYEKKGASYVLDEKGRRKIRKDVIDERMYAEPQKVGHEDYESAPVFLKAFIAKGENTLFWLNDGKYYKKPSTLITDKQMLPFLRPGNQETWGESAKFGQRPVSPYMAEAAAIYTIMMGIEGFYYWDSRNYSAAPGYARQDKPEGRDSLGDIELMVKGIHRVSQFNKLFEGDYSFIRPTRHYDTHNRDHPIIRGLVNGQYLAMAMTNPYLDPGEKQEVEVWYDSPYSTRTAKWTSKATILGRKNHIYQCKLPPLPAGQQYDPDKLYFRYTLKDGNHTETFTVTGNYDVKYPFAN